MIKLKVKYYFMRWFICCLAVIDHLIGVCTAGIYCTSMANHISTSLYITWLLKRPLDREVKLIVDLPHLPWQPGWHYCRDGDCIFIFWSNEVYYGKWLNDDITVYISEKTDKPVGVVIYGVEENVYAGEENERERNSRFL